MKTKSLTYFLDANVFVRALTEEGEPKHIEEAKIIFELIRDGEVRGVVHSLVIHEVLYVLMGFYELDRIDVYSQVSKLLELSGIEVLDVPKDSLFQALDNAATQNVDFPDCIYAELVRSQSIRLFSFDKDFKKLGVEAVSTL